MPFQTHKTSVLVIEDNALDFRLLQEALRDVDAYAVKLIHAPTLGDGLLQLSSARFDVALLDLSLPDTDGLDGLERIQKAAPELPVLVITGHNDADLAARAVREGAQDYLIKGHVDGHLLVRAMRYARERMSVLRQLKRSEERFRSLLENGSDIIMVLSADGSIKYASPSVERVLGFTPESLLGQPVTALLHPEDAVLAQTGLAKAIETGETAVLECRVRHSNGSWRVLENAGRSLIHDPSIEGVVVNARDVTERKETERQLRELNDRLQAVIETCPLPIISLDLEGRVQGWNRAAQETFGWTEEELLGREFPAPSDPSSKEKFDERLARARAGQHLEQVETRYRHKDGSQLNMSVWSSVLRDENGDANRVVLIAADVTERRRLEEQVQQSQKMEAIGRLAGGVAHDFNNLLTVIGGYGQLALNRQPAGSPAAQELKEVLNATDRAASLTKQLLALSRRQVVEPGSVDVNTIVTDMQRMLHRVIGEDIELRTRLWPNLARVRADRSQLELVLLNLAVNARDAMPEGGTLDIETAEVDLDESDVPARKVTGMFGRAVVLSVSDNGTGMDEQVRAHLFEPFFTTKEAGKGTGLGLSTSYGIIRQHGGDIWVYSEPGLGSTFKVYLPVAKPDAPAAAAPAKTHTVAHGTETILLVEDDPNVASVMTKTLRLHGYRILVAHQPEEALEIAQRTSQVIHLLLSDMVLQSVHGVDLARQIRDLRPGIPVLFVSGYAGTGRPGKSFLEPGVRFLQKPFSPETLANKVREVLNESSDGHERT